MKFFWSLSLAHRARAVLPLLASLSCQLAHGQIVQSTNNVDWNSAFSSTPVSTQTYITEAGYAPSTTDAVGVAYTSTIRANDNGGTNTFGGESLTIAGNTRLLLKANTGDSASANLILNDQSNTVLATGGNTGTTSLSGTIEVPDDADAYLGMNNTAAATLAVGSTLTGSGTLNLGIGGDPAGETLSLTGDLSGFTGTIDFYTAGNFTISGPSLMSTALEFSNVNGTFNLKGALYVGDLTVGSTSIPQGNYTAAQLNQLSGTSLFTGPGSMGVQVSPPPPLQVTDGRVSVAMSTSGTYSVSSSIVNWTFQGQLPNAPTQISNTSGTDTVGAYQQISFSWLDASSRQMTGFINLYTNQDTVLFSDTLVAATTSAPATFPDFTSVPQSLSFFSYDSNGAFAPPIYSLQNASSPWVFFDKTPHAAIISPASHFIPAQMIGDGKTEIGSGFNNTVVNTTVPAGFTQTSLLTLTSGINHAFDLWGTAMTNLHSKTRPTYDADLLLRYYGYWTDNGASYYYNYNNASTSPSSTANYETTLESVVSSFTQDKIPVHYMQLDSWWYDKSAYSYSNSYGSSPDAPGHSNLPNQPWNLFGGELIWAGDVNLFPNGVEAFSQALGTAAGSTNPIPFVCHARWIDPNPAHGGTYAANPTFYGVTGICCISPNYWNSLATYAAANNIIIYEQDWIQNIIQNSPSLTNTVGNGDAFFNNMSSSFAADGVDIQYCIPTPAAFMQGSEYNNVTTTRAAYDRFASNQYHSFIFASRLAESMGMWPWSDLFYSNETANLLLSNLSAGPVGTADSIGNENAASLAQTLRGDGVIVKPDSPLIPTDGTYLAESSSTGVPYVSSTFSQNGIRTTYAVAIPESSSSSQSFTLSAADLGVSGASYFYDYFAGTGKAVAAGGSYSGTINSSQGLSYFVIAPVGQSGIAFLGDQGQFVANGRKRVATVSDQSGQLTATVLFSPTESQMTLHGYSSVQPAVTIPSAQGQAGAVNYNSSTGHFTVQITANTTAALNSDPDPARPVTVTFTTLTSLVSANSQLVHGSAGTFSLPLPLSGTVAIEPREGSPKGTYTIVVNFSGPVIGLTPTLGVQAGQTVSATGAVQSVSYSGSTATITLSGVTDGQRLNLHLAAVQPGNTAGDIPINILWGDVNADGTVNTLDFLKVKSESQATLDNTSFIYDVNVDGSINIQDVLITKSLSQTYLP